MRHLIDASTYAALIMGKDSLNLLMMVVRSGVAFLANLTGASRA